MSKHALDPFANLAEFNKTLVRPGALLVTQGVDDRPNVMTIGWCHLGVLWGEPVCIVYVRPSRHSFTCLEQLRQFTVNAAGPGMAKAVGLCGTVSGRDEDKFEAAGLTAVASQKVKPPVIEECWLHYECTAVHTNDMKAINMHHDIKKEFYPQGDDFHRLYYGRVDACYGDVERLKVEG